MTTLADSRPGESYLVAGIDDNSSLREWFARIGLTAGSAVTTQAAVRVLTTSPGAPPAPVGDYLRIGLARYTVALTRAEARQIALAD